MGIPFKKMSDEQRVAGMLERRIRLLREVLRPFARLPLERDCNPNARDHIAGADIAITPAQVRAARRVLDRT